MAAAAAAAFYGGQCAMEYKQSAHRYGELLMLFFQRKAVRGHIYVRRKHQVLQIVNCIASAKDTAKSKACGAVASAGGQEDLNEKKRAWHSQIVFGFCYECSNQSAVLQVRCSRQIVHLTFTEWARADRGWTFRLPYRIPILVLWCSRNMWSFYCMIHQTRQFLPT